jgi:hypothetical protein
VQLWLRDGAKVVAKVISTCGVRESDSDHFMREAGILIKLTHPGLLQGIAIDLPRRPMDPAVIWTQWAENGQLDPSKLNPTLKCCAVASITKGVLHLHSNGVIHCDLKAENVLLDANFHALVADFGSSKLLELGVTQTQRGFTHLWAAPEQIDLERETFATDAWGVGLLLYFIATEKYAFDPKTPPRKLMAAICSDERPSLRGLHPVLAEVVNSCWQLKAEARPTMVAVCKKLAGAKWNVIEGANEAEIAVFVSTLPPDEASTKPELLAYIGKMQEPRGAEIAKLRGQIAELKREVAGAKGEIAELKGEIAELKQQLGAKEEGESILPGSLAAEFSPVLKEWLGAKAPLKQLWKSSNVQDVAGFHRACDGKANTLVLVGGKDGNIFGGFAVPVWDSSTNDYKADATKLSFIFVLKNSFGDRPTRFPLQHEAAAIYSRASHGPTFGIGQDFTLWNASCGRTYAYTPGSYVDVLTRKAASFVASGGDGLRDFEVDSYEVWAASGPPTPSA